MSTNTQKVAKSISSQTIVTIVLGIVEIVSFSIMSRLLTKADFGYYASITAIVTIFASFAETGIGSAIVQAKEIQKHFIDNAFTLAFIIGSIIFLTLFVLSNFLANTVSDNSMVVPLELMSVTLLLQCLTSVFISIMHRRLEFLRIGIIHLIALVATSLIAILLAYRGFGYYAIITKAVMQSIITCVLAFFCCKTKFNFALDTKTFSTIFKFSGWLMASTLFRNLAHHIDKLLMPRLLSVEALGSYNRPKDFINHISTKLNGIFDSALFPVLSSIQDDKARLGRAFRQSLSLLNTFAMLLTAGIALNSQLIIRIFFGNEWLDLNCLTIIIALTLIFNIDGRLSDCYLRSIGYTKAQFYFRIFESSLNIVGVIIGYRFGIIGVAVSMLITNTISKLIKILYVARSIEVELKDVIIIIIKSWKFCLIIIPVCIALILFLPNNLISCIIQLSVFIVCCILIFVFFPTLVSSTYTNTIHKKLMSIIGKSIFVKK